MKHHKLICCCCFSYQTQTKLSSLPFHHFSALSSWNRFKNTFLFEQQHITTEQEHKLIKNKRSAFFTTCNILLKNNKYAIMIMYHKMLHVIGHFIASFCSQKAFNIIIDFNTFLIRGGGTKNYECLAS